MANFGFKLTGFAPISPRGRKFTMPDVAVARIIAAYKTHGPMVPSGPPVNGVTPMRVMTDAEVVDYIFDGVMTEIINNSHSHAQNVAATTAKNAVARDTTPPVADNV